jgi:hypothetical protein
MHSVGNWAGLKSQYPDRVSVPLVDRRWGHRMNRVSTKRSVFPKLRGYADFAAFFALNVERGALSGP